MSALSFPRIYFTGYMCWDPATGNNNDFFPTYDDVHASLNWDFFKKNGINITPANFRTSFRPWVINNQTVGKTTEIPGEWNLFGSNSAYFVQYVDPRKRIDRRSMVTGGMLNLGQRVTSDPLIGTPVTLLGDPFGEPAPKPPGRLVDNNPVAIYSTQILYNSMTFGNADAGITAQRAHRMQSRFINFTRNFNLDRAGGASATWQACFPAGPTLKINAGQSQLLAALQAAIASGHAKGVMVRFNTYLNLYFQNGYFNNIQPQPKSNSELPALYKSAFETGNLFSNPCYSRVVGVLGPWYADELATCPEGRYLEPLPNIYLCNPRAASPCWPTTAEPVTMVKSVHQNTAEAASGTGRDAAPINIPTLRLKPAVQLGLAVAELDYQRNVLSIDLLNTFPEWDWEGDKADFKDIAVGVLDSGNNFTQIATLPYPSYAQVSYEASGGIVDLPISPSQAQLTREGLLAFQIQSSVWVAHPNAQGDLQPSPSRIVLKENPLTAQTDRRSIYLNESEKSEFQISVKNRGKPAPGANVLIVKYNPPDALRAPVDAIPANLPQVVNVLNGHGAVITVQTAAGLNLQTNATVLKADNNGIVTVEMQAASPGLKSMTLA